MMMSDDIDIEEHDVMDDPRVRDIFPDLAQVKMEIPYDNEVYEYEETEETDLSSYYPESEPHSFNTYHYQLTGYREDDAEIQFHSKIILGTKPPRQKREDNLDAFVLLEDWGPTLEKSNSFCNECKILFPTINALDSHRMTAHSFLVALDSPPRNVAIKSTAKLKDTPSKLCNHCHEYFHDDDALVKHLYELLPLKNYFCKECDETFQTNDDLLAHRCPRNSGVDGDWDYCCPVCSITYVYITAFSVHMAANHGLTEYEAKRSLRDGSCRFCENFSLSRSSHNKHIRRRHTAAFMEKTVILNTEMDSVPKEYTSDILEERNVVNETAIKRAKKPLSTKFTLIPKSTLFKCSKCPLHFVSPMQIFNHERMCSISTPKSYTCSICCRKLKYTDVKYHRMQHKNSTELNVYTYSANLLRIILMKCCDCDVFFEQRLFWSHFYMCDRNTRLFHCSMCNVNISLSGQHSHEQIHKDLKIKGDHFIKLSLMKINKSKSNYKKIKAAKKTLSNTDVTDEKGVKRKLDCVNNELTYRNESPSYRGDINLKIYYCVYCECYVTNLYRHTSCKKNGNTVTKHRCDKCAMTFTNRTAIVGHKSLHKKFNIKLRDFTFLSMHTEKPILPPVPTFDECERCWVSYNNELHVCHRDNVISCELCNKTYTQPAYLLHKPYHQYSLAHKANATADVDDRKEETLPALIKRYKALNKTWNILYSCKSCDVITDAYDDVIDHSQNHLAGEVDIECVKCDICDLDFLRSAIERHRDLHNRNSNVARKSFKNIEYDHKRLFKSNWIDTFSSLPEVQFQQILSQSIYNATCDFKMRLHQDGPVGLTMYQCEKCRCYLPDSSLHTHIMFCLGQKRKSLYCRDCKIYFTTPTYLRTHLGLHKSNQIDLTSFRIIRYNGEGDVPYKVVNKSKKDFNVYRCKKCYLFYCRKKNALRHITCPSNMAVCKICKLGYDVRRGHKHKLFHEHNPHFESKNISFQDFDPEEIRKEEVAEIYKCRCGLHFTSLKNIKKHENVCDTGQELSKVTCSKCGLLFPTDLLVTHLCVHHRNKRPTKFLIKKRMPKVNRRKKEPVIVNSDSQPTLYKCSPCDVHFLLKTSLLRHIQSSKHQMKLKPKKCLHCDLKFSFRSNLFHMLKHHNGRISELRVVVDPYSGNKTPIEYTVPMNKVLKGSNKVKKFKKKQIRKECTTETEEEEDNRGNSHLKNYVFKCYMCSLHCLSASSVSFHLNSGCHQPQVNCDACGLAFSELTLSRHKLYHHQLRKKPIVIEASTENNTDDDTVAADHKIPLYRCRGLPGYFSGLSFLQSYIARRESNDKKLVCYKCPICCYDILLSALESHFKRHHIRNNRKREDFYVVLYDINQVDISRFQRDVESTEVNDGPETEAISSANIESSSDRLVAINSEVAMDLEEPVPANGAPERFKKVELYKCVECNVHFVNRSTCYKHLYKHVPLILSLTYCMFCQLKFTSKSLNIHMLKHHCEHLELEDIVITEYWQTGEGLKSRVCSAAEKLQSKQISTTTAQDDDGDSV